MRGFSVKASMIETCCFYLCTYIDSLNPDTEVFFVLKLNDYWTEK
jgi:hypothetical protein